MEKRKAVTKVFLFYGYNTYKDYHLMIFQALPPRILPAVFSLSDLQSKC